MDGLNRRHIQDFANAAGLEPHWGYADRVKPCTNDAGSCAYLDVVYESHDLGMLYSGIIWITVGGILFVWLLARQSFFATRLSKSFTSSASVSTSSRPRSTTERLSNSLASLSRRWLLPESIRPIFGRATRLQVLILAILVGYLTIWSFVGIVYKTWITPVKNTTLYNTRTSLGPFSDRVGLLAYAIMPFAIMLSSRESILSLFTGIPYQHFNFLHRWLGYVIFAQSVIHTVGWTVIETVLYQPQPKVGKEWITQNYMIWGIVAQIFITFMFVLSFPSVIKLTGYEFFRKSHYVMAMLFVGACWAHWSNLACFMIASLVVWFIDRGIRLVRTALMHYNYLPSGKMGFTSAQAGITHYPDQLNGDVVRLDFVHPQDAWNVGQHFYLCFPELSIWQSHPFTPASLPRRGGMQQHSYIIRSKLGETKNLAQLATSKGASTAISQKKEASITASATTPVILTGPYSENLFANLDNDSNILCVAGGTGISYILPILMSLAAQKPVLSDRRIEFIWAIRMENDARWVQPELELLEQAAKSIGLNIQIFVTRECCTTSAAVSAAAIAAKESKDVKAISQAAEKEITSSSQTSTSAASISSGSPSGTAASGSGSSSTRHSARPDLHSLTTSFVENTVRGSTTVFASGPASMISDLRQVVSKCNDPSKVWKGQERWNVRLVCDDRLEW